MSEKKIITLRDKITGEPIYPVTSIDAVITDDGIKFRETLEQKLTELENLVDNLENQAIAATNSIETLTGLSQSGISIEKLEELKVQVEENKTELDNITKTVDILSNNSFKITDVVDNSNSLPTSMAVKNYVDKVVGNLIGTTDNQPAELSTIPKILVNKNDEEVYITAGNSNDWWKIKSEIVDIPGNYRYFAIEALESGNVSFSKSEYLMYSINGGNDWNILNSEISVNEGDRLIFKKNSDKSFTPTTSYGIGTFLSTGKFNVSGNALSLYYEDFTTRTTIEHNYLFIRLFYENENLVSAKNLVLPATTLANQCYNSMFKGCTLLIEAPELPATTLADYCYDSMFFDCTSLTTAPQLPATTLATNCYSSMFYGCTSLTTAPQLPATTLATGCYGFMFQGCTSLTEAPELPATILKDYCYSSMFYGCTSLTTAPQLPATTLASYCYNGMFKYCTSLTTAPELPATILSSNCYSSMFSGCTLLTEAPQLPATTLAGSCYSEMFYGCTSLIEASQLPATTLASSCYYSMFAKCTSLTTAPQLPATILSSSCYSSMFYGCKSLTNSPELPATTLTSSCYNSMFNGCSKLNYITMLATDISADLCLFTWVKNVASSGTFVKHPDMTTLPSGSSGIPSGWTVEDYVE